LKISLNWLQDFVSWTESPEELAHKLTLLGLNVEGVEEFVLSFPGVVVARVVECEAHPNADRLSLCQVHDGTETVSVVCGAPNVRAGLNVLLAQPGAVLPGGFRLKKTRIRGVESRGMICSGSELGLSQDSQGILELPGEAVPGTAADEMFGFRDTVFDIEVTPNRPDWLSHLGVAREIAALNETKVQTPPIWSDQQGSGEPLEMSVEIEDFQDCPRYTAHGARGVEVGPSPAFIRNRLSAVGSRPINNVVDITNYVLFELGQPLHAFDRAKLSGSRLFVRRAAAAEKIATLDGSEHELSAGHLVIADRAGPVAVAGVIGGLDSQVDEGTEDLILESAFFDPLVVRRGSHSLQVSTDSSYRFEREADWDQVEKGAKRALYLLQKYAGGQAVGEWVDRQNPDRTAPQDVPLRVGQVNRLLGTDLDTAVVVRLLQRLDLKVVPLGQASDGASGAANMMVEVPSFRRDLKSEVDLIEEVARLYGYDNIPEVGEFRGGRGRPRRVFDQVLAKIRRFLVGAGYYEISTSSFFGRRDLDSLQLAEDDSRRECLEIANPHHGGEILLRTSLLPSFLRVIRHNLNSDNQIPARLFQVNKVFWPSGTTADPGTRPDEKLLPAEPILLQFGLAGSPDGGWDDLAADLVELKGVLEALGSLLRLELRLEGTDHEPFLAPGRQWRILDRDGQVVGSAGTVAPAVGQTFSIQLPVGVAEIELSRLDLTPAPVEFRPFSRFPAVKRDLSLVVPGGTDFAQLEAVIQEHGAELLEELELFDIYRGKGIPDGCSAVGIRLKFRSDKGNLRGKMVDKAIEKIQDALAKQLDVGLRS